jgi:hypothetical protein
MIQFALVCLVCWADGPMRADAGAQKDLDTYEASAAKVGRDAAAHVRLALWCKAQGLEPQRQKHLALAVLNDPRNLLARGLLGQVEERGKWRRPENLSESVRDDADLAARLDDYRRRRGAIPDTAEAHWQLAGWCEQNALEVEDRAHLAAVVRLNPAREDAWKKLGCRKQNGRWMTTEQVAAQRVAIEAQRKADARWRPLLLKWKGQLGQESKRREAEAAFQTVDDPRAITSIWRMFALGGAADQERAIVLLRRIDAPAAARALASLAVTAETADLRRMAAEGLAGHDPRAFAGILIGLLRDPIKFEVREVGGPGMPGELYIKGEKANTRRFYSAPPPLATIRPGDLMAFDEAGMPYVNRVVGFSPQRTGNAVNPLVQGMPELTGAPEALAHAGYGQAGQQLGQQLVRNQNASVAAAGAVNRGAYNMPLVAQVPVGRMMLQAQQQSELSRQRLQQDVAALQRSNEEINRTNDRVLAALKGVVGEDLGAARETWSKWWNDLLETCSAAPARTGEPASEPKPSRGEAASPTTTRRAWEPGFEGGTKLWTSAGLRAVEELRTGDRMLAQNTTTGGLEYTAVLTIRHRGTAPLRSVALGEADGELPIAATDLERFWVAGKGWSTARDLKPGDVLRKLRGVERVSSVSDVPARSVYHVQVAEGYGLFVDRRAILVHDARLAEPVASPFDAVVAPVVVPAGRGG